MQAVWLKSLKASESQGQSLRRPALVPWGMGAQAQINTSEGLRAISSTLQ